MGVMDGKVTLVVGTGAGLGKEVARAVLREGGRVAMADLRVDVATGVRSDLDPEGVRTSLHQFDLSQHDTAVELVSEVIERHGRLDGLALVAAYDTAMGSLLDSDAITEWERMSKINVAGNLALIKAAAPELEKAGNASVVFVGSVAAVEPSNNFPQLAYGLSKATMVGMTHYMSRELGPRGIRVNDVAAGYKWGPVLESAYQAVADQHGITLDEATQPMKDQLSLRRFADDADVANAMVFFLSPWSQNITGQVVYVDAGQVLH